jgi:Methyltransferase domain
VDLVELEAASPDRPPWTAPAVRHPWETARFRFLADVLARAGLLDDPGPVVDIGAGDAWFAGRLAASLRRAPRLVCWDPNLPDALVGRRDLGGGRSLELSRAPPEAPARLALLLDVLEHVEDDAAFLRDLVERRLAPGAHLLVTVPAWPALFSAHDVRLRHHRRYTRAALRALLAGADLTILRGGGLFHALLVPRGAQVALEALRGRGGARADLATWRGGRVTTALVEAALRADAGLGRAAGAAGIHLPGLSEWALCRAP